MAIFQYKSWKCCLSWLRQIISLSLSLTRPLLLEELLFLQQTFLLLLRHHQVLHPLDSCSAGISRKVSLQFTHLKQESLSQVKRSGHERRSDRGLLSSLPNMDVIVFKRGCLWDNKRSRKNFNNNILMNLANVSRNRRQETQMKDSHESHTNQASNSRRLPIFRWQREEEAEE